MSYVANLKVQRVLPGVGPSQKRDLTESLNLTVRAETLEGLKSKLTAHIDLMDLEDIPND